VKSRLKPIYFERLLVILFFTVGLTSCGPVGLELPGQPDGPAAAAELAPPDLQPDPELSPEEVVRIQVEALQNNDAADTGIEITFRFASPANKKATGPLFRFTQLVKNPVYRPMLNHKLAEYGPMEQDGDKATQQVTIVEQDGSATVYLFSLSRQSEPPCLGCWLTDRVTVVPTRSQDLQGI
jgi:hypothetical protein